MRPLLLFLFIWTSSTGYGQQNIIFSPQLIFKDVIGDTLRYDFGDPVFDVVITSDTTLYWRSLNPRYGTAAREKITVMPIGAHENLISYFQQDRTGICWYNDFKKGIATVSIFQGDQCRAFSGRVIPKADYVNLRTVTGRITDEDNAVIRGISVGYSRPGKTGAKTWHGVTTDADGIYSISVLPSAPALTISYEGYFTQTVPVGESDVVNVIMPYVYFERSPKPEKPAARRHAIVVTGRVTDEENAPLRATIRVRGTSTSVQADGNGRFSLQVPPGNDVLTFTSIKHESREIILGDRPTVYTQMTLVRKP